MHLNNSKATDLNCGSTYGATNTDITGLTVYSDERNVILVAGSATNCHTYISKDGGSSWIKSKKEPTGGSDTEVLMAPDFADTGIIYAATSGDGSALSISRDIGSSWNQISLIDTSVNNIVDFAPSPQTSQSNAIFMITSGTGQSLWRSMDDGSTWERILCSNSPGVDNLAFSQSSPAIQYRLPDGICLPGKVMASRPSGNLKITGRASGAGLPATRPAVLLLPSMFGQ